MLEIVDAILVYTSRYRTFRYDQSQIIVLVVKCKIIRTDITTSCIYELIGNRNVFILRNGGRLI
jgi:hypothetical protein